MSDRLNHLLKDHLLLANQVKIKINLKENKLNTGKDMEIYKKTFPNK